MSQQPSEEKALPASDKKLRDARKKGRVSSSQDFVTALVVSIGVLWLWLRWPALTREAEMLLALPAQGSDLPAPAAALAMLAAIGRIGAEMVLPVVAFAVAAAVIGNMIVKRGILFAIDPITPKFQRLNPAQGFKQIFSLKSLIDFLKSLLKVALLMGFLGLAILLGLNVLLNAPSCGMGCVGKAANALFKPLLVASCLLFLVIGLMDIWLQRMIFLRDMRMTKTESKRERKEQEGEPLFKRMRRRQHRDATMASARVGVARANLVLAGGAGPSRVAAALRFLNNETPAPILVARGFGEQADHIIAEAQALNLLLVEDASLAERVARRGGVGAFVPKSLFREVAMVLVRHGLA